jgi:hypothetical protein
MSNANNHPEKEDIQVPRDEKLNREPASENVPPEGRRTPDEYYARDQQPLPEGSAVGEQLHRNPPKGQDQLTTGSGGDSARPGKEGIYGKPIPPRGNM